ncbi:rho gtpase activating protein at 5a [Anaeramoeba flamelloides]|uniref:Rho gtpase activating protein at 5a n=1 Tax=Anaeramoeba flamelloides TaxID=1746091 RepID=A0AAV7YIM7_9EUKA|nr:rho gtpase activating protein at 5a isoform a [Anaeramoeba flamelloides]KAJ6242817.1 rho gtpase activating protein at 5a [Anaeramoeba flamelloides]
MSITKSSTKIILQIVIPNFQRKESKEFEPTEKIKNVLLWLCKKFNILDINKYGLYCSRRNGFWLDPEENILSYELWNSPRIEFKKKRTLQIKVDYKGEVSTIPVDENLPIKNVLPTILRKFHLDETLNYEINPKCFILDKEWSFIQQEYHFDFNETIFYLQHSSYQDQFNKKKIQPIFGRSLYDATNRSNDNNYLEIPSIITTIINFIEKDALKVPKIYQQPGIPNNIAQLKNIFNRFEKVNLKTLKKYPHDITNLLKIYLCELSEPIISLPIYQSLCEIMKLTNTSQKMNQLKQKLQELDQLKFKVASVLFQHLFNVALQHEKNQMNIEDLARSMGLFFVKIKQRSFKTSHNIELWSLLIQEYKYFFFEKQNIVSTIQAKVLHDFEPTGKDDLRVVKDEIIEIIEKGDEAWWTAKNEKGETGLVPYNYVQIITEEQTQKKGKFSSQLDEMRKTFLERCSTRKNLQTKYLIQQEKYDSIQLKLQQESSKINNMKQIIKKKYGENIFDEF